LIDGAIEYEKVEAIREVSATALLPIVFLEERRYAGGRQRAKLVNVYRPSVEIRQCPLRDTQVGGATGIVRMVRESAFPAQHNGQGIVETHRNPPPQSRIILG
jgi:hypothetical protein